MHLLGVLIKWGQLGNGRCRAYDYKKLKKMTNWIYRTGWKVANAPKRPAPEANFELER
ncbi:MAG TPA: hypothetical protein VF622_12265 [Segetibacter sp.]|jgi:hypothetical protein